MTEQQCQLVIDNHNLIYHMLKKLHLAVDDYYDVAAIGLCKAAMKYNPEVGVFTTYACRCIIFEIVTEQRLASREKRQADKDVLHYNSMTDEGTELIDFVPGFENPEKEATDRHYIDFILTKLKPKEIEIFYMIANAHSYEEIAASYNLSRQRIQQIVCQARQRLKRYRIDCK